MARKNIKRGISYAWWAILIFVLLGVVFIRIIASSDKQKLTKYAVPKDSPTYITPQYTGGTINDGVYSNDQYGFRFRYPKEIFVYYGPTTQDGLVTGAAFRDNKEGIPGNLNLDVFINFGGNDLEYYNKFNSLPLNTFEYADKFLEEERQKGRSYFSNRLKIRNLDVRGIKGFVIFSKYIGGETEPMNSHSFTLLKDGNVITVQISSPSNLNSDPLKEKRLDILNNIINSFEFYNPAQTTK